MSLPAERAFFDGEPCQHVAAYLDHLRLQRIERQLIRAIATREWNAMPVEMNARDHARAHLAAMPADRRDQLEQEWNQ